jgi:ubiquinone/menaquinone biosynthesis C-methylase UbiE
MTGGDVHSAGASRPGAGRLAALATAGTIRRQRRVWSGRVKSWDQHGSANLAKVTAALLAAAQVRDGEQVVDLGCGNGQLSLPLAERGARVLAVDVSQGMVDAVLAEAARRGLAGVEAVALPIETMNLPDRSVDLIVSSYALHHLRDRDKARLMQAALRWLRPGGRLVLADMMLGRGTSARDRQIIARKVAVLARKGPGGLWRIAKNVVRYQLRVQERPVSMQAWISMMTRAGFADVVGSTIVAEAGLVIASRPGAAALPQHAAGRRPRTARPG